MIAKIPLNSGWMFAGLILVLLTVADRAPAQTPPPPNPAHDPTAVAPGSLLWWSSLNEKTRAKYLAAPAGKQPEMPKQQLKMPELPSIQIKGRIIGGLRPNSVLLQIDTRLYLVQKGMELTIPGAQPDTQTIRVVNVTADEVRIEVVPLGRVLTLN